MRSLYVQYRVTGLALPAAIDDTLPLADEMTGGGLGAA
jgi:hypothetical protein